MLEMLWIALKRLFLGVKSEDRLPPLSLYTLDETGKKTPSVWRVGMGNFTYLLQVMGGVSLIGILLLVLVKNVLAGQAQDILPTATWTQPAPTATQLPPTPTVALPTPMPLVEPTAEPEIEPDAWTPHYDEAEWYKAQCIAANGVFHPFHHEQAVGQVVFLPDYETAEVLPSCNYVDYGVNQPQAIVLHFTDYGTLGGVVSWFRKLDGLSTHYLIDREGTVYQFVPEGVGARHVACAGGTCLASCPPDLCGDGYPELKSIGIELLNYGYVDPTVQGILVYEDYQAAFGRRYWEDYPDMQLEALKALVCDIAKRWGIPIDTEHVLGHYRINQKVDPGPALNLFWERLGVPNRSPVFAGGCE